MLVEPLVPAVAIEMAHVLVEDGAGVSLVVDQHSIGALGAHAADEPFGIAVRPPSLGRVWGARTRPPVLTWFFRRLVRIR